MKKWIAIFWVSFAQICLAEPIPTTTMQHFISVADIHFDPYATCTNVPCDVVIRLRNADVKQWESILSQNSDTAYSAVGQNTNYPLLQSSIKQWQLINEHIHPAFVLALGDFLAHDFRNQYRKYTKDKTIAGYQTFVSKTLQFITNEIKTAFPHTDVYAVVGNNDSYTGNYHMVPNGNFFKATALTWSTLITYQQNQAAMRQLFPFAGYYVVTVPDHPDLKIIVLNTVLFSVRARGNQVKVAALQQLSWLEQQLKIAANQHQHVILAFHIPVGLDMYATLLNKLNKTDFWRAEYRKAFEKTIQSYKNTVTGIFAAHIHLDIMQLLTAERIVNVPVEITPSISPIYGNNPSFKIFTYDPKNFVVQQQETYFYPLAQGSHASWKVG